MTAPITPPTDPTDSELGFPPTLATRLRTTMTEEVDTVTAHATLFDDVRARRDRRRRVRGGMLALAGVAAGVLAVVAVAGGLQPDGLFITPDPANRSEDAGPPPDALPGDPADGTDVLPAPEPPAPFPTGVVAVGDLLVPQYEVATTQDGQLAILDRGSPDPTAMLPIAVELPGPVQGVAVRPGSNRDDLTVAVAVGTGPSTSQVLGLVTGGVDDARWVPFPEDAQPPFTGLSEVQFAFSPDGDGLLYGYPGVDLHLYTLDGTDVVGVETGSADVAAFSGWARAAEQPDDGELDTVAHGLLTNGSSFRLKVTRDDDGRYRLGERLDISELRTESAPTAVVLPFIDGTIELVALFEGDDDGIPMPDGGTEVVVRDHDGEVVGRLDVPAGEPFEQGTDIATVGDDQVVRFITLSDLGLTTVFVRVSPNGDVSAVVADGTFGVFLD